MYSRMLVGFTRLPGAEHRCYELRDADSLPAGLRYQGGSSHGVKTIRIGSLVVGLHWSALWVGFASKHPEYGCDDAGDNRQDEHDAKRSAEVEAIDCCDTPNRQQHHAGRDGDEYQGCAQQCVEKGVTVVRGGEQQR